MAMGVGLFVSTIGCAWGVEPVWEFAVQLSANVQASPTQIVLSWPQDTLGTPNSYTVYRKTSDATTWGAGTTLPGTSTSFTDNSVTVGAVYEYQVVKAASNRTGYGYIRAGIQAPLVDNRGKVLLIVDNTYASQLATELQRLQQDLAGDGWTVAREDVSRQDSVVNVRNRIRAAYDADPANVKAVFLFGHVPVPYSGLQNPDGHPEHRGAWPADVYYGDVNGTWTDSTVSFQQSANTDAAERARLSNVPGDGKFDQTLPPSAVELQVGRVDLAGLPGRTTWGGPATFPSELELLRQYLNKDHNFRHRILNPQRRAVVGDYFGVRDGEAFAASGYRNFSTFFGPANVVNLNRAYADAKGVWIPHLAANDYLWAYGAGAGSYSTIGGLGNTGQYYDGSTVEFVRNDVRAVFTLLFGSWLGDWDHEDNIMRSVLATPTFGLASAWSGRPHWFAHPMALGETLGYTARLTQNNNSQGLYKNQLNDSAGSIPIALMGDPTLRLHVVTPPAGLTGTVNGNGVALTWSVSPEAGLGYHVYRASNPLGPFSRLTPAPTTSTSFLDTSGGTGARTFMVRAVKLETAASGSYSNSSQGIFWSTEGQSTPGDTSPPSIVMTSPANAATVSGTMVSVSATASDNVGVAGVQFKLDGANLSVEDVVAPFSVVLNTTNYSNGTHTLSALARDQAGNRSSASVSINVTNSSGGGQSSGSSQLVVWMDDALPAGATGGGSGAENWNWVTQPTPFSGTRAHQSILASGQHEHYFNWATPTFIVNAGDILVTYVYVDPANPPSELMLSWNADNWEHRAYWGANLITYGTDGTSGRRYMGPMPPAGQWVRLEVPAAQVGLQGALIGMGFSAYNGQVTWDVTGKTSPTSPTPTLPSVTVTALEPNAAEAGSEPGVFAVTRTGSTQSPLVVTYSLGGTATAGADFVVPGNSVTLASGASSANITVVPIDDAQAEAAETIVCTLNPSASYTVGSPGNAVINLADRGSSVPPTGTNPPVAVTADVVDYVGLTLPKVGEHTLHILSPTLLELRRINGKQPDPARVDSWDFVDSNNQFHGPALSEFVVKANGQTLSVQAVGFKRRPLYAPLAVRDLRIDNCLLLRLASPLSDGQAVEVTNPSGALWPTNIQFKAVAEPLRFSPALHVNQEGYLPSLPKRAKVGYYLGSFGEMDISSFTAFKLVDARTGAQVYQGSMTARKDSGYGYSPTPYQKVYEADFSSVTTPGEYRLVVPGLGASLPFMINDGVAMAFARTYALGLYHQRCGTNNTAPFTRHGHDVCHVALSEVPSPQSSFAYTWSVIAAESANYASNPRHTAPQLKDEASQLYPFVNRAKLDVSGGHHDAGDYSKYTINSAGLIHYLMFTVDTVPGAAALDNLGLPESGDGISDLMQEAKWEADFLAKMQDADGGFYFLVYPRNRRYENGVTPDHGDPQIVWPKNTAVSAAAVAALAQCASSPAFRQRYPAEAASYLQKARLGWQFLVNAIARYGKDGAYQKITSYGDEFMHDDELAWAACEMFLATGESGFQQKLLEWFPNPTEPGTRRWGWWRLWQSYGYAIRSYAFAARTGRLPKEQLNAAYLTKCEEEIVGAANDALAWSEDNAYGTSFPLATKQVKRAGWYFSSDHSSDMAAAYQLNPRAEYLGALVANVDYEGGCNPVNVTYVTGLGWKRQREIVHQYAQNDRRVLPPSGIPLGNIQEGFYYMNNYQGELNALCFPQDWTDNSPYPFYDRWGDAYNVMTEFVHLNQARSLLSLSLLSSLTTTRTQPWTARSGQISVPTNVVPVASPVTLSLQLPAGMDLSQARVVWEGRDQEPAYGSTFVFSPKNNGLQWVEAEVQWPDGRRVFATNSFYANSPTMTWVDDALPQGAVAGASGGDSWTWVSSPAPFAGTLAHQSSSSAGLHTHHFSGTSDTLDIGVGDVLFAYIYLDPAHMPREVMLQWNDGSWEHRAYWGANLITYGTDGTAGRRYMGPLPASGKWVRLEVPAAAVGLEGRTLNGIAFTLFDGSATWDATGKTSPGPAQNPDGGGGSITLSITKARGASARLTWPSVAGKAYRVSYKNDVSEPTWRTLATATATGATSSYTDTSSQSVERRFYIVSEGN